MLQDVLPLVPVLYCPLAHALHVKLLVVPPQDPVRYSPLPQLTLLQVVHVLPSVFWFHPDHHSLVPHNKDPMPSTTTAAAAIAASTRATHAPLLLWRWACCCVPMPVDSAMLVEAKAVPIYQSPGAG